MYCVIFAKAKALTLFSFTALTTITVEIHSAELVNKSDIAARYDIRESKTPRWQYRFRWYSGLDFNNRFSLNTFVTTGCSFDSSYNEIKRGKDSCLNLRRLFGRYETDKGKLELGVIPPYKGRVSSTGLSKDGWITGLRWVNTRRLGTFELVAGEVSRLDSPNAVQTPEALNYLEMEFSSASYRNTSFEIAAERILGQNYLRGELRYAASDAHQFAVEWISLFNDNKSKSIVSYSSETEIAEYPIELFAFASFVNESFGKRAELTEDFVNIGRSYVLEAKGPLSRKANWFLKLEQGAVQSRVQLGLRHKL